MSQCRSYSYSATEYCTTTATTAVVTISAVQPARSTDRVANCGCTLSSSLSGSIQKKVIVLVHHPEFAIAGDPRGRRSQPSALLVGEPLERAGH